MELGPVVWYLFGVFNYWSQLPFFTPPPLLHPLPAAKITNGPVNAAAVVSLDQEGEYWLVAVGDSFASGEGNPDSPADASLSQSADWISPTCHRSRRSWTYGVYEQLTAMLPVTSPLRFTYLACVGARIRPEMISDGRQQGQLERVAAEVAAKGRSPDLLLMSVGGNDIGFSEILFNLFNQARIRRSGGRTPAGKRKRELPIFSRLDSRFIHASHELDLLGYFLSERVRPKQVLVSLYFDITRNESGQVDSSCSQLAGVTLEDWRLAERLIWRRLNAMISEKARKFGWTVLDEVPRLFKTEGICSRSSLIRSGEESVRLQGDAMGAFHPIEEGHRRVAEAAMRRVDFARLIDTS